jgi:hypothetical protein
VLVFALLLAPLSGCDEARRSTSFAPPDGAPLSTAARQIEGKCAMHIAAPCDVRALRCQQALFEFMQCLSGVREGVRPPVRFVSEEVMTRESEAHRQRSSVAQAALEHAATRLGLMVAAGERPLPTQGFGPSAYYAPRQREILVVERDAQPATVGIMFFVLAHEYVHALQDRGGRLAKILETREERTFDEELALWSILEGEAALFEELARRPRRKASESSSLPAHFARQTDASDDTIARQRRPLDASFLTFPYTYGAYWASSEWALLSGPMAPPTFSIPASSYEVMARRHGFARKDASCPRNGSAADLLGPALLGNDTFGSWVIQSYARRRVRDRQQARRIAGAWRGDWLSVYSQPTGVTPSFVWRSCWSSPVQAAEMLVLIEAQLREGDMQSASVSARGNDLIVIATGPTSPRDSTAAILSRVLTPHEAR